MKYNRYRFLVQFPNDCEDPDWRPIKWPPAGPYWCSGQTLDNGFYIVAYVPVEMDGPAYIMEFWPEARDLDLLDENRDILYTGRFPQPEWWPIKEGEANE